MNTLEAFHMRCQRQILDVCWWAHVSTAEVLQRPGLTTIGDILHHRRLSLFGHVARLDRVTLASSQCLAQQDSGGCQRYTAIYAVEIDRLGSRSGAKVTRTTRRRWWWWWRMTWKLTFQGTYRLSRTGIVECLKIIDVGCNLKQFDVEADRKCIFHFRP